MASSSPLLEESEQTTPKENNSRIHRWTSMFYSTVLGKDELTLCIEKVGNNQPGRPKEKQLDYLIQSVRDNPRIFDEILLKCSAAVDWQNSTVGSCKLIMAIHEIIKNNRPHIGKYDYAIIFLSEIASHWKIQENYFLERYATAVLNLSQLLMEFSVLSNIAFENGFYYSAKFRLSNFTAEEITNFVSRLLNYQNSLILATVRHPGKLKETERTTNQDAHRIIVDESKRILPLIDYLINTAEDKINTGQNSLLSLREQRETQERTIQELEQKLHHFY